MIWLPPTHPTDALLLSREEPLLSPITNTVPSGTWQGSEMSQPPSAATSRYGSSSGTPSMLTLPSPSMYTCSPGRPTTRFTSIFSPL